MAKKHWDYKANNYCTTISQGEIFISDQHESVLTIVGLNYAVCLRDTKAKIGGMSNFLIPCFDDKDKVVWAEKFGIYIMDTMLNCILELGGSKNHIEGKIFGGNEVLKDKLKYRKKSITFLINYMNKNKINLKTESTGGKHARKVYYTPTTGIVEMRKLSRSNDEVYQLERQYINKMLNLRNDINPDTFQQLKLT